MSDNIKQGNVQALDVVQVSQKLTAQKKAVYNFVWVIPTMQTGENEFHRIHEETRQNVFRSGKFYSQGQDGLLQDGKEYFEFFYAFRDESAANVNLFIGLFYPSSSDTKSYKQFEINHAEINTNVPSTLNTGFVAVDCVPSTFPPNFLEQEENMCVDWVKNDYLFKTPAKIRQIKIEVHLTKLWNKTSFYADEAIELFNSSDFFTSMTKNSLVLDGREFLFSPLCSDVKIHCGEREFFAHKIILTSKSSVFRTMFGQVNMIENKTGRVVIEDFEEEIIEEFLRFIYTGSVTCLCKNASRVCLIADKYDVQPLKTLCENYLLATISIQNVHERLSFGKTLNSDKIINKCNKIIQ